jgi:oleate hydratase
MKAHIVGGGFGGLAAAAYRIRDAGMSGQDITIYEVGDRLGGAFSLAGSAATGYILPAGALFDAEFRCTFDLLATIPSAGDPAISVKDEFFAFNKRYPFHDRAHIVDRDGHIVHSPHFGLSVRDRLDLVRLALTPEAMLDGRRVEEFFSPHFFTTEFWLLWTTIMNPKPQSSAMEMRRFMNRFLRLLPDLSVMSHVLRTRFDQYEAIIEPMVAWLRPRGVTFLTGAFVRDIGFAPSPGRITAGRLDYERDGAATSVAVAPEDVVLVTLGSQVADLSVGSMTEAPQPRRSGRPWALWERLAQGRTDFGNPDVFFGTAQVPDAHWVTFTVTTTGTEFFDQMTVLTGSVPGSGGLVTLKNSSPSSRIRPRKTHL